MFNAIKTWRFNICHINCITLDLSEDTVGFLKVLETINERYFGLLLNIKNIFGVMYYQLNILSRKSLKALSFCTSMSLVAVTRYCVVSELEFVISECTSLSMAIVSLR
jgi:hypothetical protein